MVEAEPDDIKVEIDTDLDDVELMKILTRIGADVDREYDEGDFEDATHRRHFEATLAAYRIASGRERREESVSTATFSVTYEASEVAFLKGQLTRLDPGDAFSVGGVRRDSDRTVRATDGEK